MIIKVRHDFFKGRAKAILAPLHPDQINMKNTLGILLSAFVLASFSPKSSFAQKGGNGKAINVVFYNVENLFDTINDPNTMDDDFTPEGKKAWNRERYQTKIENLAHVLSVCSNTETPDLIGLCEVENFDVVQQLVLTGDLKDGQYGVVHQDSPDKRGIDVAFAYRMSVFRYTGHQSISIHYPEEPETTTRDILHVTGMMNGMNTHVLVNHWSSRRGGQEASEFKRLKAASILKNAVDSVLKVDPSALIIAMGDFNDHPDNKSMTEVMNSDPEGAGPLRNLAFDFHAKGEGTYNYKGEWGMLDQFLVSKNIMDSGRMNASMKIYKDRSILYHDEKKGDIPSKTYGGPNYFGGYSDHLPIVLTIGRN